MIVSKGIIFTLVAALLAIYFLGFMWLVAKHPADAELMRADKKGKQGNLALAPLIAAAVFAPPPFDLAAAAIGFPILLVLGWAQHRRLARAGASPVFRRRLLAVSSVSVAALFLMASTLVLEVR